MTVHTVFIMAYLLLGLALCNCQVILVSVGGESQQLEKGRVSRESRKRGTLSRGSVVNLFQPQELLPGSPSFFYRMYVSGILQNILSKYP